MTIYFSMLVTFPRLQRNPAVKEEYQTSGLDSISYGFLGYPVSQAADILIVRSHLVPVGEDNLPHIEQTREIVRTFNQIFVEVFPLLEPLLGEVPRLPGLNGKKMGKIACNAIYLKDSAEEVIQKISLAITDPARVRINDKGHLEICNIYQYYLAFAEKEAQPVAGDCRAGKIGCVTCKKEIANIINRFLEPIREKRAYFESHPSLVSEALQEGIARTLQESKKTMDLVRKAMNYDYRNLLRKRY